jgi:cytochrome b6-f complex iron-sulfur subunit
MDRKAFFETIGVTGAVFLTCKGLESCTHKEPLPSSKIDISLNLNDTAYQKLKTPGNFVFVSDKIDLIIAFTINQQYIAAAARCTHEGSLVAYYPSDIFFCSKHGAKFNMKGSVIEGPALLPLKVFNTSISGTTLRIFE